jgi:hypothetical protein
VVTDAEAARAEVLASREAFSVELARLEQAGRAAVDVKAKIKRNPARAAGLAAGAGFLAVGGPRRVARGVSRVVRGKKDPLPPSLLPKDVDAALRAMGDDGLRVRGALEREFANYLELHKPDRGRRPLRTVAGTMAAGLVAPVSQALVKRLIGQLTDVDQVNMRKALDGVRTHPAGAPGGAKPPTASPASTTSPER